MGPARTARTLRLANTEATHIEAYGWAIGQARNQMRQPASVPRQAPGKIDPVTHPSRDSVRAWHRDLAI